MFKKIWPQLLAIIVILGVLMVADRSRVKSRTEVARKDPANKKTVQEIKDRELKELESELQELDGLLSEEVVVEESVELNF